MLKECALFAGALLALVGCNRGETPAAAPPTSGASVAPAAPSASGVVGECDLGRVAPMLAQVFTDGHWGFGGEGTIGNAPLTPITVKGVTYSNGLGTQPPSNGSAHVVYSLDRRYSEFSGEVALNDTSDNASTPLIFRIVVDGNELWRSPGMASHGEPEAFHVSVAKGERLELYVDCRGSNNGAHAVWLNPVLRP